MKCLFCGAKISARAVRRAGRPRLCCTRAACRLARRRLADRARRRPEYTMPGHEEERDLQWHPEIAHESPAVRELRRRGIALAHQARMARRTA